MAIGNGEIVAKHAELGGFFRFRCRKLICFAVETNKTKAGFVTKGGSVFRLSAEVIEVITEDDYVQLGARVGKGYN